MNRINWIDSLRGFSMLLIVFSHTASYFGCMDVVSKYIYGFYVSLFFATSGALSYFISKESTFKDFAYKKATRLLIPYFIFSLLTAILSLGLSIIKGEQLLPEVYNKFVQVASTGTGPVWFLLTDFIVEMAAFTIRHLKCKAVEYGLIVLIVIPFLFGSTTNPILISFYRVIIGIGVYFGGRSIAEFISLLGGGRIKWISLILIMLSVFVYIVLGSDYNIFQGKYSNAIGSLLSLITGTFGFLTLFYAFDIDVGLFKNIGRHTVFILISHQYVVYALNFLFFKMGIIKWQSVSIGVYIFAAIIYFVLTIAICLLPAGFIESKMGLLFGKGVKKNVAICK